MKTIKVYSAAELKKKNLQGYNRAFENFKNQQYDRGLDHADEIMASLKALFDTTGVKLLDWSIDSNYPAYSYARAEFYNDNEEDISGQRAYAWVENNLFSKLRERRSFIHRVKKYERWYDFTRYGKIPDCPFTGVCYDEDFIESLMDSIKQGYDLKAAFNRLAVKAGEIEEAEWEYQLSEEYFLEEADANKYQYTISGQEV